MDAEALRRSWRRAWSGLGAQSHGQAVMEQLLASYAEPQRKYHQRQHLGECLAWFEQTSALAPQPAAVEVALWFHDAVYAPMRADNEEKSAALAVAALSSAGVPREAVELVSALILATKHDARPTTPDQELLVDIDLAILGAEPGRFVEYERQIRAEYPLVPGFLFRRKRKAVLQSFLDRPRIFSSAFFNHKLEAAARRNLAAAIRALEC